MVLQECQLAIEGVWRQKAWPFVRSLHVSQSTLYAAVPLSQPHLLPNKTATKRDVKERRGWRGGGQKEKEKERENAQE